ncbi:phosphatase PAP2 family protein [Helicobacter himalayensis]|uniref:phosphatase PAP2 family protein n=1 Tax=Helicobacter himalayensis TaxID=1591088 RepID=UPI003D6DF239
MKKYYLILLCALFPHISHAKSGFEYFGDGMQVLPFMMMAYSYYIDDMQGVKEQALGAGATLLTTYTIKQGFVILSRSDEGLARISQRPNNGSFDGFPSGHTSFSFSSVGFAHKHYGWKRALPLGALSTLTGISRICAQRHTTTQVIAGALLGYGLSYLFASKLDSKNIALSVGVTPNNGYTLNFIKVF